MHDLDSSLHTCESDIFGGQLLYVRYPGARLSGKATSLQCSLILGSFRPGGYGAFNEWCSRKGETHLHQHPLCDVAHVQHTLLPTGKLSSYKYTYCVLLVHAWRSFEGTFGQGHRWVRVCRWDVCRSFKATRTIPERSMRRNMWSMVQDPSMQSTSLKPPEVRRASLRS